MQGLMSSACAEVNVAPKTADVFSLHEHEVEAGVTSPILGERTMMGEGAEELSSPHGSVRLYRRWLISSACTQ